MGKPWLSIIVPCLNEAAQISGTLATLAPLRTRGSEVIVVDGGSNDDTVARATPFADQVLAAPRGRAAQMNAGAAHARGAVLLFLHADSILPPDAERLVQQAIAGTREGWGRFDVRISGRHPLLHVVAFFMNRRSRLTGIATGDQGIFVARALFEAVGGFPPIALMEDIALSKRLKAHARPRCIDACITTSGRRWEQRGLARTVWLMWRLRLAYFFGADPQRLAAIYDNRRP